jgi:hypothetical protein
MYEAGLIIPPHKKCFVEKLLKLETGWMTVLEVAKVHQEL